jgi:hypothetical protein
MQQKTTYLLFLFIGISLTSCKKTIDYGVKLNYIFVNNTKYNVSFSEKANVLNVTPFGKSNHIIYSEGPKEIAKNDFRTSPVQTLCNTCIVFYDNSRCDTLKGTGIESINNYEFVKIGQGEYELKYTFNESDFLRSKMCK